MTKVTLEAKGKRMDALARRVDEHLADGAEVVLNFGRDPDPVRVMKAIKVLNGEYEVELVVRHAELREYLEGAVAGAAIGGGVGAVGGVLAALVAGNPISLGAVATAAGIGALVGGLLGAGAAAVHTVTVYKHNGETRIKIAEAA